VHPKTTSYRPDDDLGRATTAFRAAHEVSEGVSIRITK